MNKSSALKQIIITILCFFIISTFAYAQETETIVTLDTKLLTDGFYKVSSNVTIAERIEVSGQVILHLDKNFTLTALGGFHVPGGSSLIIEGEGDLVASASQDSNAVIGSNLYGTGGCGKIIINGGNITLNARDYGACIGVAGNSSSADDAGDIIINGGHLIANGADTAACLGGVNAGWAGAYGGANNITITGGIIELNGGGNYAIGGASKGGYVSINIFGGQVLLKDKGMGGAYSKDRIIQLGWTDKDDYIQSPGYVYNTLKFLNDFRLDDKVTYADAQKATAENISGKRIIPWIEHTVKYFYGDSPLEVLFTSGNVQTVSSQDIALYKGLVTKPDNPVKAGYTFDGWYQDRSLSTPWTFTGENADIVTGDMTLYAKFIPDSIIVTTDVYYKHTGQAISINPKVSTFDYVSFLIKDRDYSYIIKDESGNEVENENVVDIGAYTIEVTGLGKYAGKDCSTSFYVQEQTTGSEPNPDPGPGPGPTPSQDIIQANLNQATDQTYYINMNKEGKTLNLDLSSKSKGFSFKVYDDGGKGGSYFSNQSANFSNGASGYLLVTVAPEYLIQVSGIVGTKTKYDYLSVYDGATIQANTLYSKIHGENNQNEYRASLAPVNSSSNQLLLYFHGTSSNCEGLDLTLTVVNKKLLEAQEDLYTSGVYYTSFYSEEENFMADSNTSVYYAIKKADGRLELCLVPDKVILKGNGVILKSTSQQITLYATNDTAAYTSVLKGAVSDIENSTDLGTIFVLGMSKKGGVGFYPYTGPLAAGKAYYRENEDE